MSSRLASHNAAYVTLPPARTARRFQVAAIYSILSSFTLTTMVQHPEVLWAQRSSASDAAKVCSNRDHHLSHLDRRVVFLQNVIYLTVNQPDIQPSTLEYKLTPTSINFKATSGEYVFLLSTQRYLSDESHSPARNIPEKEYAFDLELFAEVDPEVGALTARAQISNF